MRQILTLLILLIALVSQATDYYFSQSGSDSNNGLSTLSPKKTIAAFNAISKSAGDNFYFKKGDTWAGEAMTISNSGSSGSPITISSYGTGANPIITGFTTVSGWTNLGSNIWESNSAVSTVSDLNILAIGGVNTPKGRYPNANATWGGYLSITSSTGNGNLTSNVLTGTPNWTGAQVVIRTNNYKIEKRVITSQSGGTLNFSNTSFQPTAGHGFFFQNDTKTLDLQNEWYYNLSTKKLQVYSISQPTGVEVPTLDYLVTISGNYITITGLTFTGANYSAITDNASQRSNITISGCTFNNIGKSAIGRVGVGDGLLFASSLIENNTITNANHSAIVLTSSDNVIVRGNTISNIEIYPGMMHWSGAPILVFESDNATIEKNSISNVGYCGIQFQGGTGYLVKNNFVSNFCTVVDDGGGIYVGDYATVDGNICINGVGNSNGVPANRTLDISHGIYLDNYTNDVEVKNNSVANCRDGCIRVSQPINVNIHHNTFFNSTRYLAVIGPHPTETNANNSFQNNIFVAKGSTDAIIYWYSPSRNYFPTSDTYDYNVYARPINDNLANNEVFIVSQPDQTGQLWSQSLSEFQAFSGEDAHSTKSPFNIYSEGDVTFAYNETATTKTVSLPYTCKDMTGYYVGASVSIPAYSSKVLFKDIQPDPPSPAVYNKAWITPSGKAIINSATGRPIIWK